MREYETVLIAQPNTTEAAQTQLNEKISALVQKLGGRMFFARNMGKRSLGYPVKKQTKGIYYCLDYAAQGEAVQEIERILKYEENVLRFMTVVKNEDVDVEARAAEVVARGEDVAKPAEEVAEVVTGEAPEADVEDPEPDR